MYNDILCMKQNKMIVVVVVVETHISWIKLKLSVLESDIKFPILLHMTLLNTDTSGKGVKLGYPYKRSTKPNL